MGDVLTIQGQMVEISLQSPGKLSIFLVLFLSSTCPSLKSGTPTPIKILYSKLKWIDLSSHEVYILEVENCGLREHMQFGDL